MGKSLCFSNSTMKSTLMLLALLGLSFQVVFGKDHLVWLGRQDSDITEALDYALIPGFAICNADKGDGGLTLEELHAKICQDFITSVGDSDAADYNFEMFDSNADGIVTLKEFLDFADSLINM